MGGVWTQPCQGRCIFHFNVFYVVQLVDFFLFTLSLFVCVLYSFCLYVFAESDLDYVWYIHSRGYCSCYNEAIRGVSDTQAIAVIYLAD